MACSGMPNLCCDCKTCTHRRFDSGVEVWAHNIFQKRDAQPLGFHECNGTVIDMQARAFLYILCTKNGGLTHYLQKWTLAGEFIWELTIENTSTQYFEPYRVDSDDSQIWVVGAPTIYAPPGTAGIIAYDATTKAKLWDNAGTYADVDPDGSGGCYVVGAGSSGNCDPDTSGTAWSGNVQQISSAGEVTLSFGIMPEASSVLVSGGKVWVGSATGSTDCFCPSEPSISGCICRYSTAGVLELVCAGGEHVESEGCKAQIPLLSSGGYVNRLCEDGSGNIVGGNFVASDYDCLLFVINSGTGALESSHTLSSVVSLGTNKVDALACDGTTVYVAASGLLFSFSGPAIRHRGYLTGSGPSHVVDGTYSSVTANGSSIFAGGNRAGCTSYDTITTESVLTCDGAQPCECGDFNTRGQAVVGCGCEDGVDPTCEGTIYHSWTGCLEQMPSPITLAYVPCTDAECAAGGHSWVGDIPLFAINPEAELGDPCSASLTGTITVCYDCGVGWKINYKLYSGGLWAEFTATTTDEFCNPPSFTFTFDGTWDYQSSQAAECCGGTTGCGGFNNTTGCSPDCTGCGDGAPMSYSADMSGFEQGAGSCGTCGSVSTVSLALDVASSTMGDCYWLGTMTFCSEVLTVKLKMVGGTVTIDVLDAGASVQATYTADVGFTCLGGGSFTRSFLSYTGTECTVWPTTISVTAA